MKQRSIQQREGHRHPAVAGSAAFGALLCLLLVAIPATALVRFDFETPYLDHPGNQVWDFCLVRHADAYHVFYHTIPQQQPHPAKADTIWHAVSVDLRRWDILGPALTAGPDWWDAEAVWAPDVVFDDASERWAMLYTGVAAGMVQRACLAWSNDLMVWEKSNANPVFEPDTLTYHWSPDMNWSSFRDPFVYRKDETWHMLSTAGLRLGGYPGFRRGIVHHAVSADLVNWEDAGVFFEHDGEEGRGRDLESVQYLVRGNWHHLFFVEQDLAISDHPTSHIVSGDPSGWTMANRTVVDAGWAPEIEPFADGNGAAEIFARLAKDHDPRDGSFFVAARFDSLRFVFGGRIPLIFAQDPLGDDWPVRFGAAGSAAPTYGDNPAMRGDPSAGAEGHGWFGSQEHYGGPLSGIGEPGDVLGSGATGRIESVPFTITGGYIRLRLAGGHYPETCYVALIDDASAEIISRSNPHGEATMGERFWDLRDHPGRTVRIAIVDEETGPDGWIAVDGIEEHEGIVAVDDDRPGTGSPPAIGAVANLGAHPNPFNGGTEIRFDLLVASRYRVAIYDLAGRVIWRSAEAFAPAGEVRVPWDARDARGRAVPSGVYLVGVTPGRGPAVFGRITHAR